MKILCETNFDGVLTEAGTDTAGNKKLYLKGIFMESMRKNRNGRTYKREELAKNVQRVNEAAVAGKYILGELDHPETLVVNLKNVSHKIVEMKMDGNNAIGKAEILTLHPSGQIAKALIESGIQLGVSSRASGSVDDDTGVVEGFSLVTCDIVAAPSAIEAYPASIYEHLQNYRRGGYVSELAEAVIHDIAAQKYFRDEILKFINESLTSK